MLFGGITGLLLIIISSHHSKKALWAVYFQSVPRGRSQQLTEYFKSVVSLYLWLIIGFAGVYLLGDYLQFGSLYVQNWDAGSDLPVIKLLSAKQIGDLGDYFYFSAITLFTVGYGDITVTGWLKVVCILESFLGYIIPPIIIALGVTRLFND